MYKTTDLDKRICDIEESSDNTETLREYIRISEEEYGFEPVDLESMSDEDLNNYIEFLNELWYS
ncbi:hypothetical protein ACSXAY_10105 [Clostridium perfringens]